MKIALNMSPITRGDLDFSAFEEMGEVNYFGEIPRKELLELAADCDAILVNKVSVDEELLAACPKIKYVGVFATGYNVVDLAACRRRGITVTNVPDYSTHAVAQHTFALLLSLYSKVAKYDESVKRGDWIKSEDFCYYPYPTYELSGKTFGVYGYGNIGKAVAKIADAFGAKVVICTRTPPKNCPYKVVTFDEMLSTADIISLHCPLTGVTKNMINAQTLSKMKKGAVLINTARGGLVDEKALADALNSGKIFACLDTVSTEPMLADNPLLTAKNCIITPHVAWVAKETRMRLVEIAAQNLRAYIEGKPQNVIK